jgi:hypothetical protein
MVSSDTKGYETWKPLNSLLACVFLKCSTKSILGFRCISLGKHVSLAYTESDAGGPSSAGAGSSTNVAK